MIKFRPPDARLVRKSARFSAAMKRTVFFLVWMLCLFSPLQSAAENGKLTLFKNNFYDVESFGNHTNKCDGTFYAEIGENVTDLRRVFNYYFCEGIYTLTLEGPPETTLTLYDRFDFDSSGGYLTVRKKDDRMIWLYDLEKFPSDQSFHYEADKHSGAFEVYYHAAPQFKKNISSLKWEAVSSAPR